MSKEKHANSQRGFVAEVPEKEAPLENPSYDFKRKEQSQPQINSGFLQRKKTMGETLVRARTKRKQLTCFGELLEG